MKKLYLYPFFVVLTLLISGCGKPNIEDDCTIDGAGNATCDFRNAGDAKGDACYKAFVIRTHPVYEDYMIQYNTEGSAFNKILVDAGIEWSDEIGSSLESEGAICSGIVEPKDVVQRTKNIKPFNFYDQNNRKIELYLTQFCSLDDDDDWRTQSSGAWHRGCSIIFTEEDKNQ